MSVLLQVAVRNALAEQNCPGNLDSEEVGLLQSKSEEKQLPESYTLNFNVVIF